MAGEEGPMRRCTTRSAEEEEALGVTDRQAPANWRVTKHTASATGGDGPEKGSSAAGELPEMGHCSSNKRKAASCVSSVEKTADAAVVVTGASEGMKSADSASDVIVATTGGLDDYEDDDYDDDYEDDEPPVPEGKVRLSQASVDYILSQQRKPSRCLDILNSEPDPSLPRELVEETSEIYLAAAKSWEETQDKFAKFQDGIRRQYMENGVVYLDADYYGNNMAKARERNNAAYLKAFSEVGTEEEA